MYSISVIVIIFVVNYIGVRSQNIHADRRLTNKASFCSDYENPCENGGLCLSITGYNVECFCPAGFAGPLCDYPEAPNNFCYTNPCHNGATCSTTPGGGFRCHCSSQFTGFLCEAINYQSSVCSSLPCDNGGTCIPQPGNTDNVFSCICSAGWTGPLCDYSAGTTKLCGNRPCDCTKGYTGYLCSDPVGVQNA